MVQNIRLLILRTLIARAQRFLQKKPYTMCQNIVHEEPYIKPLYSAPGKITLRIRDLFSLNNILEKNIEYETLILVEDDAVILRMVCLARSMYVLTYEYIC